MSVWREVQEALYQRWRTQWVDGSDPRTPYVFENKKMPNPIPDGPWARFSVKRMPGGPGTLGRPGNRKMDRVGRVFIQLFEPPLNGTGRISDLGELAAGIFEDCRILGAHDIRFGTVEPGEASDIDNGRWWGLVVDGRFEYEQLI